MSSAAKGKAQRKVIFVVGTTAAGKSDWALRWAEEFGGVIFNCDSVQLYKKLDIGAAKPSADEQVRVPHYLLDYVSPPEEMTAGKYCRDFYEQLEKIPSKKPVFVVGGTGFYFMAIEKGMYPVIPVSEEMQKAVLAEMQEPGGAERLHQELSTKDPEYGAKIHKADHYRIGRAIELIRTQGRSVTEIQAEFAEVQNQNPFPYPLLKVGPSWDRDVLDGRIKARTLKMLEAGLLQEVRGLLDEGLEGWAPLSSVGYREVLEYFKQPTELSVLAETISLNTRQLAKRQRTWFQRDKDIQWFDGASGFEKARAQVENFLNS